MHQVSCVVFIEIIWQLTITYQFFYRCDYRQVVELINH